MRCPYIQTLSLVPWDRKVALMGPSSCVTVQAALAHRARYNTTQASQVPSDLERPCAVRTVF